MKAKIVVGIVTAFVLFYSLTLIVMGIAFISAGGAGIAIGLGLFGILIGSMWSTVRELRFGVMSQKLAHEIARVDGVPIETVTRDARGRVNPAEAEMEWQRRKAFVDAAPEDWRAWFLLGIAYDNARDRKQARAAIRKAIVLFKQQQQA